MINSRWTDGKVCEKKLWFRNFLLCWVVHTAMWNWTDATDIGSMFIQLKKQTKKKPQLDIISLQGSVGSVSQSIL